MGHHFATAMLGPLLLLQGRAARRRIPRLPEPPGERQGTAGNGPPLSLLITGDSAAAGVGAAHQRSALLGHVVAGLATRYTVDWTLQAVTGATTESTLKKLKSIGGKQYDVVLTSLGVNDITGGINRSRWRQQQGELRRLLRNQFHSRLLVVSGLPPVDSFPALPQPLRWYLGRRARQFDRDLQQDVSRDPSATFLSLDMPRDHRLMASDGFHPGPKAYEVWGKNAAETTLQALQIEPAS